MKTLSLRHAAATLDVVKATILRWAQLGQCPQPFKMGKQYKLVRSEIMAFKEGRWLPPEASTQSSEHTGA